MAAENIAVAIRSNSYIPLDVISVILNHFKHSKQFLLQISLVCRSWVEVSRRIAFKKVALNAFIPALQFVRLIETPLCTIKPCIRDLTINIEARWLSYILHRLTGISNITKLSLSTAFSYFHEDQISDDSFEFVSKCFPHLKSLKFGFDFDDRSSLLSFIYSFPHLEDLVMRARRRGPVIPVPNICPPQSLRYLKLHIGPSGLLEWFASGLPQLEKVVLSGTRACDLPSINQFLVNQGPSLETFIWNIQSAPSSKQEGPDFSECTALRSITINYQEKTDPAESVKCMTGLIRVGQLNSLVLRNVTLKLPFSYYYEDKMFLPLDKLLSKLPSQELRKITVFTGGSTITLRHCAKRLDTLQLSLT